MKFIPTQVVPRLGSVGAYAIALLVSLGVMFGSAERSEAQIGGASVVFLMIEPDSRAAGMGNAGVALADNASAVFWNPAGLAFQEGAELALTHSNWLPAFNAGLFYEYLVGKYQVEDVGTFGGHVTFLNLGEHERRDSQGEPLGVFRSYDLAVGGSFGRNITRHFSMGVGARLIYSNLSSGDVGGLETNPGLTAGLDLSGLYRSDPITFNEIDMTVSAGFNLANMGPQINYSDSDERDPIPTNLRMGYALTFDFDEYNRLTFVNDFNKMLVNIRTDSVMVDGQWEIERSVDPWYEAVVSSWRAIDVCTGTQQQCREDPTQFRSVGALQQLTIGTGLEYWYDELFALRTGYFYENPYNGNRSFLTFGAGLRYNIVGVDFSYIYALEENSPLSDTMRFSLLINLGS